MSDHLNLSLWLTTGSTLALPTYLEKVLQAFPFSLLRPGLTMRVNAISFTEPPLLERLCHNLDELEDVHAAAQEFLAGDAAIQLETWWDLYQPNGTWKLKPSPVLIDLYGPEFDRDQTEQLRIDAGAETLFIPEASETENVRAVQANARSLLRLAGDLTRVLPVEKRLLWSESGDDLAERLEDFLEL